MEQRVRKLLAQDVQLFISQQFDARDVPMLAVELNLLGAESITRPGIPGLKQGCDWVVITRQIFGHQLASLAARLKYSNGAVPGCAFFTR